MCIRDRTSFSKDSERILLGLIRVSFFMLVVKVFGLFKEIAIANRFGVSDLVDSYTLANAIVFWIPAIWISVINSVFVPLSHKLPSESKENFQRNLFGVVALAGSISTFALIFIATHFFPVIFDKHTESGLAMLIQMCSGLAPIILILSLIHI